MLNARRYKPRMVAISLKTTLISRFHADLGGEAPKRPHAAENEIFSPNFGKFLHFADVWRHFEPNRARKLSEVPMNPIFRRAALLFAVAFSFQNSKAEAQAIPNALCETGECQAAISAVEYEGRAAYKLTDGRTEAVVVPEIGRIMRFGSVGGPNLLWNLESSAIRGKGYGNYGGDKTWLAPQTSWKEFHGANIWPPDADLDGSPHQVEILTGGKVQLISPLSVSGMRLMRTIYFEANGELVIEQTARKEKGAPIRAALWNITQTVPGQAVFLPRDERSTYPDGIAHIDKRGTSQKIEVVTPRLLRVIALPSGGAEKTGVDSPVSAIASVRDGVAFVQKSAKPAGVYPDGQDGGAGLPVELFTLGTEKNPYYELELLGPLKNFSVGGKSTHTLRWSLHDLPSKNVNSPAVTQAIEKLLYER